MSNQLLKPAAATTTPAQELQRSAAENDPLYKPYIGFPRDRKLQLAFRAMIKGINAGSGSPDIPDKRRILVVSGESGAGKTRAVIERIRNTGEMQPWEDEDGVAVDPVLWFKAPSPSTPQKLAYRGLQSLKFPISPNVAENKIWDIFQAQIKANRKRFVVIDEAQDAIETANRIELLKIASALKDLVQMSDWSIRLILIGVPPLAEFMCRKQLFNRRTIVPFERVKEPKVNATVKLILDKVIGSHAGQTLAKDVPEDFRHRLSHACAAEIGSIIQMVRGASENATLDGRTVVELSDFEETYTFFSGCLEEENVFTCKDWHLLDPFTAVLRDGDVDHAESRAATYNTKPVRRGRIS
ncbi:Transposition protein, putative [Neorhizobium galegae bv. orientalis]|nr:Transposition protein, putative [Neorhizobium galegae bv. orientalis]